MSMFQTLICSVAAPAYRGDSARWAAGIGSNALRSALSLGRASRFATYWSEQTASLRWHFGVTTAAHCFLADAHGWADFHEPQITAGLAHFLNADPLSNARERIRAILAVAHDPASLPPAERIARHVVLAEADAPGAVDTDNGAHAGGRTRRAGRIDLLVSATWDDGRTAALVLEAKFEHRLSAGQLISYERAARTVHRIRPGDTRFLVVAPARSENIREVVAAHPAWRFLSWDRLLVRLERQMADVDCDDDDYRRFRRTVWTRAER